MIEDRTIRQWWDIFKGENALTEIRVLSQNKTFSGYFTSVETMLPELKKYDGVGGIYATLNQVKESCYGRTQRDEIQPRPKSTTSDGDIERRRWLLIDFDPKRPSDTNASDAEKAEAEARMRRVYKYLRDEGFNAPVVADSANGYHLYYSIDLPNDEEATELIKNDLRALDIMFSDEKVDVDTSVFNASRIVKVIGTSSNKGTSTKERPQRISKFIHIPDVISATGLPFLKKLAGQIPQVETPSRSNGYNTEAFDLEDFITRHGIEVIKRSRFSGGEKLVLDECPFDKNHKDSAILHLDNGALAFKCFHNSCSHFTWKDFRLHFDPQAYNRAEYEVFKHKRTYYGKHDHKPAPVVEEDARGKKWLEMTDIKWVDSSNLVRIPTGLIQLDEKVGGLTLGDITILSGLSGAGKTTLLNTLILSAVQRGYKAAAWSGELQDSRFQSWLDQQAAGRSRVEKKAGYEDFYYTPRHIAEKIHTWLAGKFYLYNNEYGSNWNQLREDIINVIHESGVQFVVLDNLMALDFDGAASDNDVQTTFIKDIKNLAKRENIHCVIVCHPRKEQSFQLLRKESIAGTANLTNLCDNLFIVHRVGRDFERRAKDFFGDMVVQQMLAYDVILEVAKNRSQGVVDYTLGLYYEKETRRILNDPAENVVYGWEEELVQAPIFPEDEDIPDEVWYAK